MRPPNISEELWRAAGEGEKKQAWDGYKEEEARCQLKREEKQKAKVTKLKKGTLDITSIRTYDITVVLDS